MMKRWSVPLFLCSVIILCGLLTPGNAAAAAQHPQNVEEGVLLVAFGTSEPEALKAYTAIESSYKAAGHSVLWAYTSEIIRNKMAKSGKVMLSVEQALDEFSRQGVRKLIVQSLHIAPGEEFAYLERKVAADLLLKPGRFTQMKMARPLLESRKDLQEIVAVVLQDAQTLRKPGQALVLMAHGQAEGRSELTWVAARTELTLRDPLAFLATVEGEHSIDDVLARLKRENVSSVLLQPFMVVAGDHARNDLSGQQKDSWASRLEEAGISVSVNLKGLGEIEGVRAVFLRHTDQAVENFAAPKKR